MLYELITFLWFKWRSKQHFPNVLQLNRDAKVLSTSERRKKKKRKKESNERQASKSKGSIKETFRSKINGKKKKKKERKKKEERSFSFSVSDNVRGAWSATLGLHRNIHTHRSNPEFPMALSRVLVNRHEINSGKERAGHGWWFGLGRKNRNTRGRVGAREPRGRQIYSGYSPPAEHKECSAFDGLRHRALPAATLACRRARPRSHASTLAMPTCTRARFRAIARSRTTGRTWRTRGTRIVCLPSRFWLFLQSNIARIFARFVASFVGPFLLGETEVIFVLCLFKFEIFAFIRNVSNNFNVRN